MNNNMIELTFNEFVSLALYNKRLPVSYSLDTIDGERYYHIFASEMIGAMMYNTSINSLDDPEDIAIFEHTWKANCNKKIEIPGMDYQVQALMLSFLEGIQDELTVLNKRIEYMIESHITYEDAQDD
jgi:hypothetical protein